LLVVAAFGVGGCNTYADSLARGQRAFEQSEHERALAIFRALELESHRLSTGDRAHYAYLRGMTDYRIGYKADARHWLSLGAAIERQTPGSLPSDWARRMKDALKDLDESVFSAGIASLSTTASPPGKKGGAKDDEDDSDTSADPAPAKAKPPVPAATDE
jgi:hypothetical protein